MNSHTRELLLEAAREMRNLAERMEFSARNERYTDAEAVLACQHDLTWYTANSHSTLENASSHVERDWQKATGVMTPEEVAK